MVEQQEENQPVSILLTDYAVTASLFPQDFYQPTDGSAVSELVRWMAPESLSEDFKFSSHTDVVSVLLLRAKLVMADSNGDNS